MLKKARLVHYNFQKGFGFLECLGYSGQQSAPKQVYFRARTVAFPSPNRSTGSVSFRYPKNLPFQLHRPGLEVLYKPDSQNQRRAFTVCHPKAYLNIYTQLHTHVDPNPQRLRFFLSSWTCAELCTHPTPGIEASLQYLHARLQTLQKQHFANTSCRARLQEVARLFHRTLCALRTKQPWAVPCLELLRYGLLHYDNLLAQEAEECLTQLLSQVPSNQQRIWSELVATVQAQPSLQL